MSLERNDFIHLREKLFSLGYDRKTPYAIIGEWLFFIGLFSVGIIILILNESWWLKVLAMYLIILSSMGISTNAHTASHHAISGRKWLNDFFLYFGYPFFLQLSASYWRQKHLVIHHPHPNVIGIDNDATLAPFFALNQDELHKAKGWHGWWYRHQGYFLPFILVANSFVVVFKGWIYLLRELYDSKNRNTSHWFDLVALMLHWIVFVIIPLQYFQAMDVLWFTLARYGITSYAMFVLFAPAHYPASAMLLDKGAITGKNFLMLQTLTTINFRTGFIGRLICGGVEFQIEHHLFPSISPKHYPEISVIVKEFCDVNGYPYRTESWIKATFQSILTFWQPKPIQSDFTSPITNPAITTKKDLELVR